MDGILNFDRNPLFNGLSVMQMAYTWHTGPFRHKEGGDTIRFFQRECSRPPFITSKTRTERGCMLGTVVRSILGKAVCYVLIRFVHAWICFNLCANLAYDCLVSYQVLCWYFEVGCSWNLQLS